MPPALQGYLLDMRNLSNGVLPPLPPNIVVNRNTWFWFATHWTGIQLLAQIFRRTLLLVSDTCRDLTHSVDIIIQADVVGEFQGRNYDERVEAVGWTLFFLLNPLGFTLWLFVFAAVLSYDIAEFVARKVAGGVASLGLWVYSHLIMPTIRIIGDIIRFPFLVVIAVVVVIYNEIMTSQMIEDLRNFGMNGNQGQGMNANQGQGMNANQGQGMNAG